MLDILLVVGGAGIIMYLLRKFLSAYEEAKKAGYIYDEKNIDEEY